MKKNIYIQYFLIAFIIIVLICTIYNYTKKEAFQNNIANNSSVISTAYVINLDKRPKRWKTIQSKFKDSNIQLMRFSAVQHRNGYLGNAMSFMKAIRFAKENNLDTILIFEDDNKPLEGYNKRWLIIKEWLDNNLDTWDIYNGGARFPDWSDYWYKDTSPYVHETKLAYSIQSNEYLFKAPQVFALNWFYANKNAYDRILEWEILYKEKKVPDGIDRYLCNSEYFNHVFSIPVLALQESGESDTTSYQDFDKTDKTLMKIFNDAYEKEVGV